MKKDIEKTILSRLSGKKSITVADIVRITGFSRAYISRFFKKLADEGRIALIGKANKAHYIVASKAEKAKTDIVTLKKILKNKNLSEDMVLREIKGSSGIFKKLPKNVEDILDYGFTEMLNNAIEHSKSKEIVVSVSNKGESVHFDVIDRGIGIFNNIQTKRKLRTRMEAIQDLLKGKQTTLPAKHSGEGIFFTSKVADEFFIQSSDKKIIFDNRLDDTFIKDSKPIRGTKITFKIAVHSRKKLSDIFKKYTDSSFAFTKTRVKIHLYEIDTDFISRSQARRILAGLEKFKLIVLDFKNIRTVGQGFADEIFRIWKSNHKDKEIEYENANENVLFMIRRALHKD